jgi:predicted class III extradiol MEMO1 family dioxygenase
MRLIHPIDERACEIKTFSGRLSQRNAILIVGPHPGNCHGGKIQIRYFEYLNRFEIEEVSVMCTVFQN